MRHSIGQSLLRGRDVQTKPQRRGGVVGKARRRVAVVVRNAKVVGDVNGGLMRSRGLVVVVEPRWRRRQRRAAVHAGRVLVWAAGDGARVEGRVVQSAEGMGGVVGGDAVTVAVVIGVEVVAVVATVGPGGRWGDAVPPRRGGQRRR